MQLKQRNSDKMQPKSPFYVIQEFLSPLQCEEALDDLDFVVPDYTADGRPIKMVKFCEPVEALIYERLQQHMPALQAHYGFDYAGTEQMFFEWYPEECSHTQQVCENSSYIQKKWQRTALRDFTCVLFLSEFQTKTPFDSDYEVYGGKLEFPSWGFGFNPQRGTLIVYPSGPNFVNRTTPIIVGDLFQARIHISATTPYKYDKTQFPGNFKLWFSGDM